MKSYPQHASYSGAKAALNIMTEYLHSHLYLSYGVSAHIIAPGSLKNEKIKEATVSALWDLEAKSLADFTMQKIF
jgi:NAD(P)-dependent dehydrogenase (short-subunit alcohol dehydrogenase family)